MTGLTLTHTHAAGTLLEGTTKGDGTAAALKACGWRWSRTLGTWYVPRSRDTRANSALIETTRAQLERAGFTVAVDLDDTPRPYAQVEADTQARIDQRAQLLQARAETAAARADVAEAARVAAAAALPPAGEPIHVGHHSQARHERAIARAHATLGASVQADAGAAEATRRARVAAIAADVREAPVTVANRIGKLGADLRATQRRLDRFDAAPADPARAGAHDQLRQDVAVLTQKVAHWTAVRDQQIAEGTVVDYGPHNVTPGDAVQIRGHWYPVVRANRKTVAVRSSSGDWTNTAPWAHVRDHRPATTEEQS